MRLVRLLIGVLAGYALVRRLLASRPRGGGPRGTPLPPTIPIRVEDPYAGGDGPGAVGPDTSTWPEFDEPRFHYPSLPLVPECDTVYMLVYVDAFQWGGATRRDAVRQATRRGPQLLAWARDQARRYCARNAVCEGVVELDHLLQWEVYELADEDIIELTLTYFFRCDTLGQGETKPPKPQSGHPPYGWGESREPWCNAEYTYLAHERTKVANLCLGADAHAARQAHERTLLAAARTHARDFCNRVPNPYCRDTLERGWHITHRCADSRTTGESWVVSTLVYRFDCAALA